MVISSNTLFHFTKSIDNIISILRNGFWPQFSLEDFSSIKHSQDRRPKIEAIPMICFCDIPLSQISRHVKRYGAYGIGLSKAWGKQKGLNPLVYITDTSDLNKSLHQLYELLSKQKNDNNIFRHFFHLSAFIKPYLIKNKFRSIRYYDEREWRYVPDISLSSSKEHIPFRLSEIEFNNVSKRAIANSMVGKKFTQIFLPSDINYIFVETRADVKNLIKAIDGIFPKKESRLDLYSKILTMSRIKRDF
jgi:hypothetical protein